MASDVIASATPSSARTNFIALVAMQALHRGTIDDGAWELIDLVEHPGFGRGLHLAVSSTTPAEDGLSAKVRILDNHGVPGRRWNEAAAFAVRVHSEGVTISMMEEGVTNDRDPAERACRR